MLLSCTHPVGPSGLLTRPCMLHPARAAYTQPCRWRKLRQHKVAPRAFEAGMELAAAGGTDLIYEAGQRANELVLTQLTGITPATYAAVLAAGLATSLSPCTLSVLPLTIGYIGGYARTEADSSPPPPADSASSAAADDNSPREPRSRSDVTAPAQSKPNLTLQAVSFSAGLATTLAALGLVSSSVGRAYGQIGAGLPIAVSALAIVMGLNLLEVLPMNIPSLDVDVRVAKVPPPLQAYLAGLAFALAASPCSTPVLATLLAWVSSTEDPAQGAGLLLAYSLGYVAPLLLAASVTGAMRQLLALRQYSAWVTPASGALLVAGGTYTMLSRLIPS